MLLSLITKSHAERSRTSEPLFCAGDSTEQTTTPEKMSATLSLSRTKSAPSSSSTRLSENTERKEKLKSLMIERVMSKVKKTHGNVRTTTVYLIMMLTH